MGGGDARQTEGASVKGGAYPVVFNYNMEGGNGGFPSAKPLLLRASIPTSQMTGLPLPRSEALSPG